MSTLKVDNIQATGETASRAVSGVAAAWVNFNGTGTVAINDSINVASLTDNGTGQFTFAFSSGMSNSTYSITATSGSSNSWSSTEFIGAYATGSFKIETGATNASSRNDWSSNNAAIHGDLA
tara:strand:+ start:715 stop:1080 length:366 start_codon:yes stop_codon:yes gene_type:complete